MNENYLITIKGIIRNDDDEDIEELTTTADYFERDDKKLIKYREFAAEQNGNAYAIINIIKIEGERITHIKRFEGNSGQMIFESGIRHQSVYLSMMGQLSIGIYTDYLYADIDENGSVNIGDVTALISMLLTSST